ncbi:retrovirus-related pol polyprotein from transposon TNT 1-94 [Tanacetum coccineum]
MHMLTKPQAFYDTKPQAFYDNTYKQALGYQHPFYLMKAQRIKPTLYDGVVMSNTHVVMLVIDDEETLILEQESRSKMFEKAKDPKFDSVVKKRTTPSALEEGEWGFEHTKAVFNNEIIPFLKSLKDIFNVFDKDLLNEITEVQTVFDQMEASVQQFSVDKKCLEIAKKEILLENDRLLQKIMSQDVLITVMNSMSLNNDSVNVKMQKCELCEKCLNLDAELSKSKQAYNDLLKNHSQLEKHYQLQDKVFVKTSLKNDLRKVKGKEIVKNTVHLPSATTISPDMFKLDLVPLPSKLLQNRDVHIYYLRNTQEQANILWDIVEQAKAKQPLDGELDLVCKYATRIQELLVYVQNTCPNAIMPSTKKVVVTPMNNVKKVRFAEPLTSSSNIKQVESSKLSDSNTPALSSTGVKCSTNNCGSKPIGNKKNDRIPQKPSRNKKNKVEAQPRKVVPYRTLGILDLDVCQNISDRNHSPLMNFVSKISGNHLCSACALGKSKKSSHQPKAEDTNQEKLYLLHMDLCGPMRVASFNEKRYILVIVDDYSRFTWVRFLKTKDEAPAAIIKCIKNIQVHLNATVQNVRTDNGTEFVNQTLREWYENVGIRHQTSVARTPQQNGGVERRNQTLVKAARTMLIFSKAPLFLWAYAINTSCYTQNRSLIRH